MNAVFLLQVSVAVLALLLAFNLKLLLILHSKVSKLTDRAAIEDAPGTGDALPLFAGTPLTAPHTHRTIDTPVALLFLSSACPKCEAKLPSLDALLPYAHEAGVGITFVSLESTWRLKRFIGHTAMADHTLQLTAADYRILNPALLSPAYIFINGEGRIEARGMLDDDNWHAFVQQLTQTRTEPQQVI
ncbi:redoxin domain-containing protein [Burkholderiaceae bacterium DAT-1]|nr:redoxin domain-containing protein [Burkholderiaceae bacterium DAT-1]